MQIDDKNVGGSRKRTWMVVLEFGQVVNVFVDDDPKIVGLVVRGHVVLAECLGHGDIAKQTKGQICGMLETKPMGKNNLG